MIPSTKFAGLSFAVAVAVGAFSVAAGALVGVSGLTPATARAGERPIAAGTLGVGERTVTLSLATTHPKFPTDERAALPAILVTAVAKSAVVIPVAPRPKRTVAAVRTRPAVARVAASPKLAAAPAGAWKSARVSWYGPGFYGNRMAGGGTLELGSMVVAHRSLPFGTRVLFEYRGRTCVAVVMDRGPYVGGRTFDLGPGTAKALGFGGVGTVRYRVLGR